MAKQEINIGSAPNAGDGDRLRRAFTKINENFTEVYTSADAAGTLAQAAFDAANTGGGGADLGDLVVSGGSITTGGVSDIYLVPNGEGYAYVTVPNDSSAANGAATVIGNGRSDGGGVQIQSYNNTWQFNPDGSVYYPNQATSTRTGSGEALLFNKSNSQKIIGTKNGTVDQTTVERLVISGGDAYGSGEGGDIYLWAGRSATDTNGTGSAGDIKVDAGQGYDVAGGTIKIRGGSSHVGSEGYSGAGGWIEIDGGDTYNGGDAGDITLTGGRAFNGGTHGKVRLSTVDNTYIWDFGADGVMTFPNGSAFMNKQRYGMGDLVAYHDGEWTLGEHNGDDFGTIGMRINPGIEGPAELILPSNSNAATQMVSLNNYDVGGVKIQSGSSNTWTFGADSSLTIPGGIKATSNISISTPASVPTGASNWQGGGGWNQGLYSDLATTGGNGTGLTVDVAANGGGYINAGVITINNPGSGYLPGDVITINNENDIPGTFTLVFADNTWEFANDGSLTFPDTSVQTGAAISIAELKTLVAASTDFEDFQTRIAAL